MEEEVEEEMDEIPNPNSSFVLEVKAEDHLPDEVAAVDDIAVDAVAVDEEDDGDLRSLEGEAPNSSHAVANSSLVPQHMLFGTQPSDSPPTTDAPTTIDMEMEERPASPLAVEPLPFTPFTSLEISDIDLHAAAMKEIERRHLTHSYTAMEATCVSYRLTQPMLSKFSKDAVLSTPLKARMVRASLVNWLNYSCPRPVSQKDENSFCSNCGISKFSYPNQLTFLGHVGQCGKIRLDSPAAAHLIKLDEEEEKAQEENDDGDVLTDNDDSANLELLGVHSAEPSLVLVKWMDRGQSYKWVDINAVRILKAAKSSSGASEGPRKRRREAVLRVIEPRIVKPWVGRGDSPSNKRP
eukprot:scaffold1035_cov192-Ochromonas_danica.AAC.4